MLITHNTPLNTTLQLPCIAKVHYVIQTPADIAPVLSDIGKRPFKILGAGSNVLCASTTLEAVVQVAILGIVLIRTDPQAFIVQVGAGEAWHNVVMHTLNQGWAGLENLALIPGWVGAAPVQNIGAYGVEVSERLHSVQAWDRQHNCFVSLLANQCQFGYRDSIFKQNPERYLITHVTFELPRVWQPVVHYGELAQQFGNQAFDATVNIITPRDIADAVIAIRQRKLPDPILTPNAGSFFKNPLVSKTQAKALQAQYPKLPCYAQPHLKNEPVYKLAAGWLIETALWKGHTRSGKTGGTLGVHTNQALVLVHLGGATGADVIDLAKEIQNSIMQRFGISLDYEVNIW